MAAQDEQSADEVVAAAAAPEAGPLNVTMPTLGGMQLWTDELHCREWRIQRNVYSGHFRLLDGENYRRAWGSLAQCKSRLVELQRGGQPAPMSGTAVIVLHGLWRSRASMEPICGHLRENGDWTVLNVGYASSRASIDDHARSLGRLIDNLEGIERIHFVAHSLGNLVIRRYLTDQLDAETGRLRDERIGRIVMIAPPNQGSQLAEKFEKNLLVGLIWGESAKQIADWNATEQRLAIPPGEFGVIAGGAAEGGWSNPLLSGDDDLVVRTSETRLAGARDFRVVPVSHTFIMGDERVHDMTRRFLAEGCFTSEREREPIRSQ